MKNIKTAFAALVSLVAVPALSAELPGPMTGPEGTGSFVVGRPEGNGNFVVGRPEGNGGVFIHGKPEGNGNFVAGPPGPTQR